MTNTTKRESTIATEGAPRAWQRMLSGRRLDLLSPDPADIELADIAHGLARVARWNGQTRGEHAFSVAQHSLIVEKICSEFNSDWSAQWRLAALLHDAAEYVIGDLISPFKSVIGPNYKTIETGLMKAIHLRFDLPETLPDDITTTIKAADHTSAYFEATRLAGFSIEEARTYFEAPQSLPDDLERELATLEPISTGEAETRFSARVQELSG